jgi:hypothetical protein
MIARRIEPSVRLRLKEGAFGRALGIHPRLGLPVFALLDLAMPLPAGFAFAPFCFERDADRVAHGDTRWRRARRRPPSASGRPSSRPMRFAKPHSSLPRPHRRIC